MTGYFVKTQLVSKDFTTPGFLNTDGDVIFQDGGSWKKALECTVDESRFRHIRRHYLFSLQCWQTMARLLSN